MTDIALAVDPDERKRLGQYFTGVPLARLLAALGSAAGAMSVLDPMAGSGDMLVAATELGQVGQRLTAVEIDPVAAALCAQRLTDLACRPTIRTADAFSPATWADSSRDAWDLVITNPPYVRYQRTARGGVGRVATPSASEVRCGLLGIVEGRDSLASVERDVFRTLIASYSGLADLAVPSWLLCASLVAPGGRLAMVVPDTWLSRDYALPVLYLLRRCFEIECVVEDGEAVWFDEALVRTTLVVARRTTTRSTALADESTSHVHARLTSQASDRRSVVGALHPRSAHPERRFAETLNDVARSSRNRSGLEAHSSDDGQFRDRLLGQSSSASWISVLEPSYPQLDGDMTPIHLPRQLREIVDDVRDHVCALGALGWHVGQGLRTGANRFFYGEAREAGDDVTGVEVDPELSSETLFVPNELLRVAVRKQHDLVTGHGEVSRSPGRLFVFDSHALVEDLIAAETSGICAPYVPIPEPIADFVRRAACVAVGTDLHRCLIPELSAVVTNVRRADSTRPDRPPRFWYQLPPLAARHTGVLFVPRVNHGNPVATMNDGAAVIDANFSTFWPASDARVSSFALLAMLHSTWALAAMESSGTVLGGGALKLEATQLRRLPLPSPAKRTSIELDELGKKLLTAGTDAGETRERIDAIVSDCIGLSSRSTRAVERICDDRVRSRKPLVSAALADH